MTINAGFMVPHPPLIIPKVGRGEEKKIGDTVAAYERVADKIAELKPDTIVLTTPHTVMYLDYFHISPGEYAKGDMSRFGAADVLIETEYDSAFVETLSARCGEDGFMAGTLGEEDDSLDHGTLVPLYFVNRKYTDYKLVRIGISGQSLMDHYVLGNYIKETSETLGRKTVFIASGDLSHCLKRSGPYGYQKEGPLFDEKIMDIMGKGEFGKLFDFSGDFCRKAGECGHRSFLIMAGALDRREVKAEKLSYEGPFGVGYGICSYLAGGDDEKRAFGDKASKTIRRKMKQIKDGEDEYVQLARRALEEYVLYKEKIDVPQDLSDRLKKKKAGVFVSLKKDGQLRGCIGTIMPTKENVAKEIIENAISAATKDPRFTPVDTNELEDLVYSVDVLGEIEEIPSADELDAKKYGVIVSCGTKRGVLLPNLEGVDTVREQIEIARQKAGIGEDEIVKLERFEVIRHK